MRREDRTSLQRVVRIHENVRIDNRITQLWQDSKQGDAPRVGRNRCTVLRWRQYVRVVNRTYGHMLKNSDLEAMYIKHHARLRRGAHHIVAALKVGRVLEVVEHLLIDKEQLTSHRKAMRLDLRDGREHVLVLDGLEVTRISRRRAGIA